MTLTKSSTSASSAARPLVTQMAISTSSPQATELAVQTRSLPGSSITSATDAVTSVSAAPSSSFQLRIEGKESTIFEDIIFTNPGNVTTPSGGTHICDGTNNGANPSPGVTPTNGLQSAARLNNFNFDGTWTEEFDDFFITTIGDSTHTKTQFWGLLLNYQFTPVGGCQQQVASPSDEVLWAYNAFNKAYFLKLVAPVTAETGVPFPVTVTDGRSGMPLAGAMVQGATTDSTGTAMVTISAPGVITLKASRDNSIRSNGVKVSVS